MWAYIGTYTDGPSKGIYAVPFDTNEGTFGEMKLAATCENPSFLAIHPNQRNLYAVGEVIKYNGQPSGAVRSFSIDAASGELKELNALPSGGGAPCHLVVDDAGDTVLVANYVGGNVASLSINEDGSLKSTVSLHQHEGSSINKARQEKAHAHSINLDAANQFAFAADLGTDELLVYRFDIASGRLDAQKSSTVKVEPGSGPRHFAFHPSGQFAYLINELSSTVVVLRYSADEGRLEPVQTISTLPESFSANSTTAEIVVHPSGKFVYGSNRGHDSIAVFSADSTTGELTLDQIASTGGRTPRNFVIEPSGQFLLAENQNTNSIVVLRIDPDSGKLTSTGEKLEVPSPVCVRFLPRQ